MEEQRIIDLESKVTFQEDLLDQLNKIVTKQQFDIDQLLKEVKSLSLSASGEEGEKNAKDEIPPHY